ncbi:MAG: hypothetical protein A3F54_01840 [Candidatus Kerfeldbacteria bacterium RIFCSPHIGHO2_12_FULL_48_17]|uniref:Peptidase C39-like domain-containing protein n=1 Tax=Candidatus Kerfeldbacteria bacterium RIFCSPHIGHO2_12_FULL_48_17 TaxID=1798542 RepID=A0A1G2B868_9BACT|nr:MAG: hypothetical protein A3F54_01840 [Candidatus Kerfeldbacteria bacterium RIFCSPHIGHO2_12_FULL_48_17]
MKNQRTRKKVIVDVFLLLIILLAGGYVFRSQIRGFWERVDRKFEQSQLPAATTRQELAVNASTSGAPTVNAPTVNAPTVNAPTDTETEPALSQDSAPLPAEMNLKVPFTSQAPHANWDLPYQEACEEAAALMIHYFFTDQTFTSDSADEEINSLVDFQNEKYGFYKDTTAEETVRFIKDRWGYENVVVEAATVDAIKKSIADGVPVILPAAGRQLHNPYFSGEGPLYHMLVVKGYTKDGQFITNDPGTKRGEDFLYDEDVLLNAVHDWNGGNVGEGAKVMIVVQP